MGLIIAVYSRIAAKTLATEKGGDPVTNVGWILARRKWKLHDSLSNA